MRTSASISQQLQRQSVATVECSIPTELTTEQWRWRNAARPRPKRRQCDHLHETTTRYDHVRKLLSFLLVCPICRIEKVIETQHYEPRFRPYPEPQPPDVPAGAIVYEFPARRPEQGLRRAA